MTTSEVVGFETFFERSCPGMLARALLLCGHRQDAEDAVQHAYAEALRYWDRVGAYDSPDAWVYRIVRQRLWKARRRWTWLLPADLDVPLPSGATVEETVEARDVLRKLATLPSRQRQVIVMHCLHGMRQQEIATELGITRASVAASIYHGRRQLRKASGISIPAIVAPSVGQRRAEVSVLRAASWLQAAMREPGVLERIRTGVLA